jgi:mitochondrial fission protein ELM1
MERPARAPPSVVDALDTAVWAVSDGRAGNVRQAEALALALRAGPVRSLVVQARWPWRSGAPLRMPGSDRAFGDDFAALLRAPPRVAIGCGRQAALATRLLRECGAQVVQVLDPRLDPSHWDLVVAPRHDRLHGANVVSTLGSLHPVDDAWLADGRAAFPSYADLPQPRTSVLVGASSRHARIDASSCRQLALRLTDSVRRGGGSVLLTASPRTPPALRRVLRDAFAMLPGVRWLGVEDGRNPYAGLLGWADRIVCSPDSVNMISEACATSVPVHVFAMDAAHGRLRGFLDALAASGRIRALEPGLAPFPVTPLRETARVATEVRARLDL